MLCQLTGVIISAAIFTYSTVPTYAPASYPTGLYNSLSSDHTDTPLDRLLNQVMASCPRPTEECTALGKRYVMSSKAMYAAQSKFQVTNGLIINNGMLHGFENVSFLAKGISMDSIQHSQTIPYGLISGEGFIRYGYYPGRPEWTMEDRPLLDILGIRAIVGSAVELPPGSFLHKIGNLPPQNNRPSGLAVYANMGAFPRAFFIDPALLSKAKIKPHCGNNSYLVCQDLSNVTPAINPWQDPIQLEDRDDSISLLATPKPYARTILVSVMWRPEWSGVPDEMAVPVSSQWGLIKVILPANQSMVTLTYDSPSQNIGRLLTLLTAVFSILGVYVLRHRRGCVINL